MNKNSLFAVSGVAVICLTIIIFSLLTPNYSHLTQTISELNANNAPYRIPINIGYTLGFIMLNCSVSFLLTASQKAQRIAGYLMVSSFWIIIFMSWFLPMDGLTTTSTSLDQLHNNTITIAVIIFLVAQMFILHIYDQIEPKKLKYGISILFFIALICSLLSLYANITDSELINLSERGWMISFLIYLLILPTIFKNTQKALNSFED